MYKFEYKGRKEEKWHSLPTIFREDEYEYVLQRLADKEEVWTGWQFRIVQTLIVWTSYEIDSNLKIIER